MINKRLRKYGEKVYKVTKTRNLDLCLSCEICNAICPVEAIRMEFLEGQFFPLIDEQKCTKCGICLEVCPGIDILPKELRNIDSINEILVGHYLKCYTAYTLDEKIRRNSTSGGIITTLVINLLKAKEYDYVFVLKFENFDKTSSRLEETENLDEIFKAAKSKYIPASVYNVIKLLKEKPEKRCIIIGTPCLLFGIKKVIHKNKLDEKKHLFLGLFCASTLNYNFIRYLEDKYSKKKEKIKSLHFRTKEKYGWPGHSKIIFTSNRSKFLPRTIRFNLTRYFKLNRCLFCFDKTNRSADISFSDCYIKSKQNEMGKSNVIIRTEKGKQIFNKYLHLFSIENEDIEEIWESQNIDNEKLELAHAKLLTKEKEVYFDYKNDDKLRKSTKKNLKTLQKYSSWGRKYNLKRISFSFHKYLFIQTIKKLLKKAFNLVWKYALPPLMFIKGFLVHMKKQRTYKLEDKNNIIILGGKFYNEGAQAMSLIAIEQIKHRIRDAKIYHFTNSYKDINRYKKDKNIFDIKILPWTLPEKFKFLGKPFSLFLKNKRTNEYYTELIKALKKSKFIIDLSGFAISSEISKFVWIPFIANLIVSKSLSLRYYIFPQSIGPFYFKLYERLFLYPLLKWYLKYPKIIYARDKQSYSYVKPFTSKNLRFSHDVVLQHELKEYSNIISKESQLNQKKIKSNSVGIIPNKRVNIREKTAKIINLYKKIITNLLESKFNVYILWHSHQDLEFCVKLKELFRSNSDVILLSEDYNSIELENIIKQFSFIISSRYHAIVHAYKNGVPAVVIGWAKKYGELLKDFGQKKYYFDIRENINHENIKRMILFLVENYFEEKSQILNRLEEIKKLKSPFTLFNTIS